MRLFRVVKIDVSCYAIIQHESSQGVYVSLSVTIATTSEHEVHKISGLSS